MKKNSAKSLHILHCVEWNITCCYLAVYHAIYLEELTAAELIEKIAQLFNISPRQINQIFKQGPTGIHVLVSDEVRPWFLFYSLHFYVKLVDKSYTDPAEGSWLVSCLHWTSTFSLTDDSKLPGWSMLCTGHNERYLNVALLIFSISIFRAWMNLIIRSLFITTNTSVPYFLQMTQMMATTLSWSEQIAERRPCWSWSRQTL